MIRAIPIIDESQFLKAILVIDKLLLTHDLLIHSPCHGLELSSPKFTLNKVKYVEVIVQGALDLARS